MDGATEVEVEVYLCWNVLVALLAGGCKGRGDGTCICAVWDEEVA
jgi:hypothetical protein